ncbi:hypothetical protein OY671_012397, partial [Metschnikowia pulcherrima]
HRAGAVRSAGQRPAPRRRRRPGAGRGGRLRRRSGGGHGQQRRQHSRGTAAAAVQPVPQRRAAGRGPSRPGPGAVHRAAGGAIAWRPHQRRIARRHHPLPRGAATAGPRAPGPRRRASPDRGPGPRNDAGVFG